MLEMIMEPLQHLRAAVVALLSAAASASAAAQGCTPLKQGMSEPGAFRYGPSAPAPGRTVVDKPGHYCLKENLRVEGHYWPVTPEGPKLFSDDKLIVMLAADDIELDFKGHSATSDAALQAGLRTPHGEPTTALTKSLPTIVPRNVTIGNGTIKASRHGMAVEIFGVGPQEALVNIVKDATEKEFRETFAEVIAREQEGDPDRFDRPAHVKEWVDYENKRRAALRATFLPNAAAYPVRNLRIENMHIRSQDYAVVLQGAGSVIRNSVIETDSGTALWLYGPNAVIENNIFIVHCIVRPMSRDGTSRCEEMDAPIRLQHGDGAVIRNNRFILKDQAHQWALSVFDTGEFTFEGNTFTGLNNPSQAVRSFRGPLQIKTTVPNRVDNSALARVKAWFQ